LDDDDPGLSWTGPRSVAKLLALNRIAMVGRSGEGVFNRSTLTGYTCNRGRVEATFVVPSWAGLTIRATWIRAPDRDGVDLEIQIGTPSVNPSFGIEVGVQSRWEKTNVAARPVRLPRTTAPRKAWVQPRDAHAASLSYDGRESLEMLRTLTTLPVPSSIVQSCAPRIFAPPGAPRNAFYIEMVHPEDCARRVSEQHPSERAARTRRLAVHYGLLGHDLEKGVVLRARLRGLWIQSRTPERDAEKQWVEFLCQAPPLGS
jgi:hypothetical protein